MDRENHLEKIQSKKKKKKLVKIKVKLPHVNKKTTSEKAKFFSNTVFSLYFEIRTKKISRRESTRFLAPFPLSACPKLLLHIDFKNHENVWTDLKRQRPNTIQILWIVRKESA